MPKQQAPLTTKQKRVLDLLEGGATIKEAAKVMNIAEGSVYGHIRKIRQAGVTLPSERLIREAGVALPNDDGASSDRPSNGGGSGFLGGVRRRLEDELASLDAQRGQVSAALRALA